MKPILTTKLSLAALIPLMVIFLISTTISDSFAIDMVTCSDGSVLVKKTHTGNHACLHESTAKIVESRGWGIFVSSNDNIMITEGPNLVFCGEYS